MDLIGDPEVDRLYTVPPSKFVVERTAAATAARQAGDRARAVELGKLRRPTVAAWLVNLLALRRPEAMAQWWEVAELMRQAQQELAGDQLRRLSEQRRTVVATMVTEARTLAVETDPALAASKLPLAEVEATLHATLTDSELAATVQAGRLVRAAAPEGFGGLPRPQLRVLPGAAEAEAEAQPDGETPGRVRQAEAETDDEHAAAAKSAAARAALEADVDQARSALEAAETELAQREAHRQDVEQTVAELEATIADLTARRSATLAELAAAKKAIVEARRAVSTARRRAGEAEAALSSFDSGRA